MRTCRKGHTYRGDENYRARSGRCPHCHNIANKKYRATKANKDCQARYEQTDKGKERSARYKQSPKGWLAALRDRRNHALQRRANRAND